MRSLLIPLLLSSSLFAQTTDVIYHSSQELGKIKSELLPEAQKAPSGQASRIVDSQPGSSMLVIVRVHTGESEVHERWADQMIIQSGSMTVVTGGEMVGKHAFGTAPGEFRGSSVQGGTEHVLHAGDTLRVPAGLPHWAKLAPGEAVEYLAVKEGAQP